MNRVLRVVVTGSECTGKTTLAKRLAAHYRTVWTPEFSRAYAESVARPLTADDVEEIARGQIESEGDAEFDAKRLLILDTDLLSTLIYGEHYYGHAPEWIEDARAEYPADLYLLCDIDVPWTPDRVRDRGRLREEMHALFADSVRRTGDPAVLIRGDWDERFRAAVEAVDSLLAAHTNPA